MHISKMLLHCGMMANVNNVRLSRQITSKVNHGVGQESVMTEIINNFIGNVEKLNGTPENSMDNNKMFQRIVIMVSR